MKFVHEGYHGDGSMCVYGYSDSGVKIAIFKGYPNLRRDTVTLYPKQRLAPTSENISKMCIPLHSLK